MRNKEKTRRGKSTKNYIISHFELTLTFVFLTFLIPNISYTHKIEHVRTLKLYFGFVGVLVSLLIILIFLSSIFIRAFVSDSYFVEVFSVILGATISYHVLLNLFMISGLFPVVGIPFPFISFAGTHNVSLSFLIGACIGIGDKKKEEFELII
jgi:uncharacterized protein YacL